jgi:peptide/nickel transport system permease protein
MSKNIAVARVRYIRFREARITLELLWKSTISRVGIIVLLLFLLACFVGPLAAPYDPYEVNLESAKIGPGRYHLFGTDLLGRDILSRVLYGARISLMSCVIIVGISVAIGFPIGMISGYFESTIGQVLMRAVDIFLAFPTLVLAIALAATFGPSLISGLIAMSIVYWPRYARLAYGETLSIMQTDYVMFAKTLDQSSANIIFTHIVPNSISPIIIQASLDFGDAILLAAVLGFLGLGAQPPSPEWGAMVSQGRNYLFQYWWISIIPGSVIFFVAAAFNLLGDGIRDALDPNIRRLSKTRRA